MDKKIKAYILKYPKTSLLFIISAINPSSTSPLLFISILIFKIVYKPHTYLSPVYCLQKVDCKLTFYPFLIHKFSKKLNIFSQAHLNPQTN